MYGRLRAGVQSGLLVLCGGLWAGGPQPGQAMGADPIPTTPALLVQCPAEAPEPDALCAALTVALDTALDGAFDMRSRQISAADRNAPLLQPEQAETAGTVRLVLAGIGEARLSGHLEWQSGTTPPQQGPEVALDVMDANLSANMYPSFTRGLLTATPDLPATWARTP